MYCYSNNGFSMRRVEENYEPAKYERVFVSLPTPEQLEAAFPEYSAAASKADIVREIETYENSITPRMLREAAAGSPATFDSGPYDGKTSAEAIAFIDAQIVILRKQLS